MEFPSYSIREAFPLIRQVLADAYKVDVHFFTHPYGDTSLIDRGFRKMLWGKMEMPEIFSEYLEKKPEYQMAVIKSSLGYYNIFAAVSLAWHHPDFITIGPFSSEKMTDAFVHRIVTDEHLSPDQAHLAGKFYEILPIADANDVAVMTQHLLAAFIPEYADIQTIYLNYSEASHQILPDDAAFHRFSSITAGLYSRYLNELLDAVEAGDGTQASKTLKIFLDAVGTGNIALLSHYKRQLYELNSFCKARLLTTQLHPYYILRLSDSIEKKIERGTSIPQLSTLPCQLVRKYCLLVRNHSLPDCSGRVRSVIQYIDLHLDEELTLSSIAGYFGRNASGLSAQFHKETGVCLTDYIHKARIQASLALFSAEDLSIEEIAARVGIYNPRYYARLFKTYIGMTPRDYKKMMHAG